MHRDIGYSYYIKLIETIFFLDRHTEQSNYQINRDCTRVLS